MLPEVLCAGLVLSPKDKQEDFACYGEAMAHDKAWTPSAMEDVAGRTTVDQTFRMAIIKKYRLPLALWSVVEGKALRVWRVFGLGTSLVPCMRARPPRVRHATRRAGG